MTWRILLDIAEQTHAQLAGAALQRAYGPAALELVRAGALIRTAEPALLAPLAAWDSDDDAFDHGYEEAGVELTDGRVRVVQPTPDPCIYRLDLKWLLRSAATALGISRTAPLTETIVDALWRLGVAMAGDRDCIFFLARRLYQGEALVKVLTELSALLQREPLIVLTTARRHQGVPVPSGIRLVSLHDCAQLDGGSISLDRSLIAEAARSAFSTAVIATEFWHSSTYDVVRLRGSSSGSGRAEARQSASCTRQARPIGRGSRASGSCARANAWSTRSRA